MIEHFVLFRLRPGVSREDARLAAVVEAMARLPQQVQEIRGWRHGFNVAEDAQAWDYALHAQFDDEDALARYFDHPAHVPVVVQWGAIAEVAFCDLKC